MADQGMLIHQMTVKGKRLSSGLEKFVAAFAAEDAEATEYAYYYALGCLGGDYLAKSLMTTKWLGPVVDELVANKLMKGEKADKLKGEWREKFVPEPELNLAVEVESATEKAGAESSSTEEDRSEPIASLVSSPEPVSSPDACLTPSPVDEEGETTSALQQEKSPEVLSEPDREAPKEDLPKVVEPTAEEIREFSFTFNSSERNANQDGVPSQLMGLFYDILDGFSASRKFASSVTYKGNEWRLVRDESVSNEVRRITYRRGTSEY